MSEHPINNLMGTVMENLKGMIDVNTIIGDAVETANGTMIIPISKVGFGFAAGGKAIIFINKKFFIFDMNISKSVFYC